MPGVALRYFILFPELKHGPLTVGARRKIIALPEVRRNGFNESSPTFISRGALLCTYRREIAREKRHDAR